MIEFNYLIILMFVCLMTSLFTPDNIMSKTRFLKKKIPINLNGILILLILMSGFASFFNNTAALSFLNREERPSAFVFFDQSTEEKVAVYRLAQTNFSNHLHIDIQNRIVIDEESIQLEIHLTNNLEKEFLFNPSYLKLINERGEIFEPMGLLIEENPIFNEFQIEAGESVLGSFLYLKPSNEINFQVKYFPFTS